MKSQGSDFGFCASIERVSADTCLNGANGWIDIATEAMFLLAARMMTDEGFQQAVLACGTTDELEAVHVAFLGATIREFSREVRAEPARPHMSRSASSPFGKRVAI